MEEEAAQTVPGLLGGTVGLVNHGVEEAALRVGKVNLLGQVAGLYCKALLDFSPVLGFLPQEDFQKGGLPCAVVPQQGNALPVVHPEGNMGE